MKFQKRVYEILEVATLGDFSSRLFDVFIMSLIMLNVFATIIETIGDLGARYKELFYIFEFFSVIIFTIEYMLRIWSCIQNQQFNHPIKGRIRFAFTAMPIIDLLAILPFYLPMLIPIDLRFLRILRLFRIFRVFKMGRYFEAFQMIANVIKSKKEELLITVFIVMIMLIFASSLMYIVENAVQPENFSSIPSAMWWGVATLTTVGYGDIYPITPIGRCLGAVISLLGIGLFALPTGFLASGFAEEIQKRRQQEEIICPHCGKKIFP
jgi:voltage-gated potassium channel